MMVMIIVIEVEMAFFWVIEAFSIAGVIVCRLILAIVLTVLRVLYVQSQLSHLRPLAKP